MKKKLYATLMIRLYTDTKCFGPGIAELLTRVGELHSLRAAAQSMSMAYSKAWTMVKTCEAALDKKLLTYTTGGRNGGGAALTDEAKALLVAYTGYCREMEQLGQETFARYFGEL